MELQTKDNNDKKPAALKNWWLVLLVLLVWNAWLLWPRNEPEVNIPYSTFLVQVQADNVSQIHIAGSAITGKFNDPLTWPQASPVTNENSGTGDVTPNADNNGAAAAIPPVSQTYTDFATMFPSDVGDPNLLPLLESHGVTVNVEDPPTPWFALILTDGLPILLLILFVGFMGRRAAQNQANIFGFGRSRTEPHMAGDHPDVTFDDVAGSDEAKADLQEIIEFLQQPDRFRNLGARIPRGVLLVGPPGTGKTLMARAVAGEARVPFFSLSASEFVEMFVGVGASRVRDLFQHAKAAGSAIVFIDELDAVGRRRGAGVGTVNDEREQTLNQLLVEMDGFDERHEVVILAATNRPDVLDPALLRPGRFDRQVVVGLPDSRGREGILRIHSRDLRLSPDVALDLLSRTTTGFSGAELANLCNEAALIAARKNHADVSMADFGEALDRLLLGAARTLLLNDHERQVVAYHESGHALVAWMLPEADPVHKVTIIPRGRALGVTEQVPGEDHFNYSRSYLMGRLAVMLGGRTAEEIVMGDVTTGAENDLVEATRLARRMITRWGMSELGLAAFDTNEEQPFLGYDLAQGKQYSEATAARIDEAVEKLLEERHQAVRRLLTGARQKLDRLMELLLQKETIDQKDLERILGKRPVTADSTEESEKMVEQAHSVDSPLAVEVEGILAEEQAVSS